MDGKLPPLNAIRAFDAAAQRLSFKDAAADLGVTNGAVSLQVKKLEDYLGAPLFERQTRALTLTPAGEHLFVASRQALRILRHASDDVRARGRPALVIACTGVFAAQWLVGRLPSFRRLDPDVEVRISASDRLVVFPDDNVDLAIRHGLGRYPGLIAEKLLADDLVVVCTPTLIGRAGRIARPDDLAGYPLLHDRSEDDWRLWLAAAGVATRWPAGRVLANTEDVLEAALAGKGLAILSLPLVRDQLRAGRLVMPLKEVVKLDLAYYLVYPPGTLDNRRAADFRDWLLREAAVDAVRREK